MCQLATSIHFFEMIMPQDQAPTTPASISEGTTHPNVDSTYSAGALVTLVQLLRASTRPEDLALAERLEASGWSAVGPSEMPKLLGWLRLVEETYGESSTPNAEQAGIGKNAASAPQGDGIRSEARSERAGNFAQEMLDAVATGRIAKPQPEAQSTNATAPERGNSDFAEAILNAIVSGRYPGVSAASEAVGGLGESNAFGYFESGAAFQQFAGQLEKALAQNQQVDAGWLNRQARNGASSGSSGVQVAQLAAVPVLGSPAEMNNADLITPYVVQSVGTDGAMTAQPINVGQAGIAVGTVGFVAVPNTVSAPPPNSPPNPAGFVSVSTSTTRVVEGDGNAYVELVFTVTRTNPMNPESIRWTLTGLQDFDVTGSSFAGEVSFAGGESVKQLVIRIHPDSIAEVDKPFALTIESGLYSTVSVPTAEGVLIDDDRATVSVSSPVMDEASAYAVFQVSLSHPCVNDVSFSPVLDGLEATSGSDFGPALEYSLDGGTSWLPLVSGITLSAGVTDVLVRTPVLDDAVFEGPERFVLQTGPFTSSGNPIDSLLANPLGSAGTATVVDNGTHGANGANGNDDRPVLQMTGAGDVAEGSYAVFGITLSHPLKIATQINLARADIQTSVSDHSGGLVAFYYLDAALRTGRTELPVSNGQILLPAGVTAFYVASGTQNDTLFEGSEHFTLSAAFADPVLKYADAGQTTLVPRVGATAGAEAVIRDDGAGVVVDASGNPLPNAVADDDRPLSVADITVNEGSPYAVFTVTGVAGQKLSLSLGATSSTSDVDATLGTDTHDAGTGVPLQYFNGSTWVDYVPGSLVSIPQGASTLLVRTALTDDTANEGPEAFTLTATNTGGTSGVATATIKDDGTGTTYPGSVTAGVPDVDSLTPPDDDRPLSVADITVNEGSPYAVFNVTGVAGQQVSLSLGTTSSTSDVDATLGTDTHDAGTGVPLQYFNGSTWVDYVAGSLVSIPQGSRTLLVRTALTDDTANEGPEAFTLTATNTGGTSGVATATVLDDGRGTYFPDNQTGNPDPNAALTDDRLLQVEDILVNEASPFAVFVIKNKTSTAQTLELSLQVDTDAQTHDAALGTDVGDASALEYFDGAHWLAYVASNPPTVAAGSELLVRTPVRQDSVYEGPEVFQLLVSPQSGVSVLASATLLDDGRGAVYPDNNTGNPDPQAVRDDDRVVRLDDIEVSETSPFAVFTVTGPVGTQLGLSLGDGVDPTKGKATIGVDVGAPSSLEVLANGVWIAYDPSNPPTVDGSGQLKVRLPVAQDNVFEGPETFRLLVSPQIGGQPGTPVEATATLRDDGTGSYFPDNTTGAPDPSAPLNDARIIQVNNLVVNEASPFAVFTVSNSSSQSASVALTLHSDTDPTTANAQIGVDFGAATTLEYFDSTSNAWVAYASSTPPTIAPGAHLLVRVPILQDTTFENSEVFALSATPQVGPTATGTATILDQGGGAQYPDQAPSNTGQPAVDTTSPQDDDRPTLRVVANAVIEDSGHYLFDVQLDKPAGQVIRFTPSLLLGATNPATLGTDPANRDVGDTSTLEYFDGTSWRLVNGAVELPIGSSGILLRTPLTDDDVVESTEQFILRTGPIEGQVSNPQGVDAVAHIIDNDPVFRFDAQAVRVVEGDTLNFVVSRVSGLGVPVTLSYQVIPSSSDQSTLPVVRSGSISFTANETSKTISLASVDDQRVSEDQSFYLSLSTATNGITIDQGSVVGKVHSNDVEIGIDSITASSGPDANGYYTFTVNVGRTGALDFAHAVRWSVVGAGENPCATSALLFPALQTDRVVSFAANAGTVASDTAQFTFQAQVGALADGSRGFQVRLTEDPATASQVVLGRDAASGAVPAIGALASIEAVTTNLLEGSDPAQPNTHQFRVVLSQAVSSNVVIDWQASSYGSGTSADANAADFAGSVFPSGRVTIAAGQTSALISVSPQPDSLAEGTERFNVDFNVFSGLAQKSGPAALGRIFSDDSEFGFSTPTFSADEGNAGHAGTFLAGVTRTGYLRGASTVHWHLEPLNGNSDATAQSYFSASQNLLGNANGLPSGTLSFASGDVQQQILISLVGNDELQAANLARQFRIVLDASGIQGSAVSPTAATATATIVDDDAFFEMAATTLAQAEGQSGSASTVSLTVNRVGDTRSAASVNWVVEGSGANPINSTDLQATSYAGNLVFGPGESSKTIQIQVNADDVLEPNETFRVRLTDTSSSAHHLSADPAKLQTAVTLNNDDSMVTFEGTGSNLVQTQDEDGNSGARPGAEFVFNVVRAGDSTASLTVPWQITTNGSLNASDFVAAAGTVTFAAGSATASITVQAVADRVVEANESFTIALSPAVGSGISVGAQATAQGTLVNDDVAVTATLVSAIREDADSPNSTYTYTLTRTGDTSRQASAIDWSVTGANLVDNGVTVAAALSAGEITLNNAAGLSWAAGDASTRTVSFTVTGDSLAEGDEAFQLGLANQTGDRTDVIGNGLVGVVSDDDTQVKIELVSTSPLTEGADGTHNAITFRITRTGDLSSTLVVDLLKTFAASGVNQATTGITGPTLVTFQPQNQTISVQDGNGLTHDVVLRGGQQTQEVTFNVPGNDIVDAAGRSFTVTLANPVATPATGRVVDAVLIDSSNGAATATLTDDDDKVSVSLVTSSVNEGDTGSADVTFTLTRTGDTSKATTVVWKAESGTGLGVNAADFVSGQEDALVPNLGMPSGSVGFAAGEASKTVTIQVSGDTTVEGDETVRLNLHVVGGNTEFDSTAQATIVSEDAGYALNPRETSMDEGSDPSVARYAYFDLSRVGVSAAATLKWTLTAGSNFNASDIEAIEIDGVAVSGTDLTNLFGNFTLGNGVTASVLRVKLNQDQLNESDETFTLKVEDTASTPAFAAITTAPVSILNDDVALVVTRAVASVSEGVDDNLAIAGALDFKAITFTVSRVGYEGVDTSASWSLAGTGITAEDFKDGILPTGTVTFTGPTAPDQTITVYIRQDWQGEQDEPLTLSLSAATPGTDLTQGSATTTILNDDALISISNSSVGTAVQHVEGDGTWTNCTFTVTRSLQTSTAQTVNWRVLAGNDNLLPGGLTADDFYDVFLSDPNVPTSDHLLPYGELSFAANETSKTLTLKVKADSFAKTAIAEGSRAPTLEGNEPFRLELFNSGSGTSKGLSVSGTDGVGYAVVLNDDVQILVTALVNRLPEGQDPLNNGGDVNIYEPGIQTAGSAGTGLSQRIVLERRGDLSQAVSFEWYVKDANFATRMFTAPVDQVTSGDWDNANGEQKGVLTWAAGDATAKTLYFTPKSNDTSEPDYTFSLKVRANPLAPAGITPIDEFTFVDNGGAVSVLNQVVGTGTPASPHLTLANFTVVADEGQVWISNSASRAYNAATSSYDRYVTPDFFAYNDQETRKSLLGFNEDGKTGQPFVPGASNEGSVYVAESGANGDFTALPTTHLTFTENQRVQTLTVNINRDAVAGENVETYSLYLNNEGHSAAASSQANQWIVDGDGALAQGAIRVLGSTAIEGVDSHLQYRIDLGKATTQDNVFAVSYGGTALQDALTGKTGDYYRYFEYSTNGGTTWESTAPTQTFTYTGYALPQSHTESLAYKFGNTGVAAAFDSWIDFSDLKSGAGYKVGGNFAALGFGATDVPLDTSGRIYVVVERTGAYIDTNNNGVKDVSETSIAFDSLATIPTGAGNLPAWTAAAGLNLAASAVTIEFNDVPTARLDFTNFNADDRVVIDLAAMSANGRNVGTDGLSMSNSNATWDFYGPRWQDVLQAQATSNGTGITTTLEAYRWAQSAYYFGDSSLILHFGGLTAPGFDLAYVGPWASSSNPIQGNGAVLSQFNFISPVTVPRADIWIPVRASLALDPNALGIAFNHADAATLLQGRYVGVADLQAAAGINNDALAYFRTLSGNSTATLTDIQSYFSAYDPRGIVGEEVKFLRFQIDWDQTGGMPDWSITGLDAADVLAPQDGKWNALQLVSDVQLASGVASADASIALGAKAAFDVGSAALESAAQTKGLTAVAATPVVGAPAGSVLIKVGAGVDSILVRNALVDDKIDESMEKVTVTVKQLSGDVLTSNFGTGQVNLVDNDAPVIAAGKASVAYDITKDNFYLVSAIDINNRAGDTPDLNIKTASGSISFYTSTSQIHNAANDQAFTFTLRCKGDWEAAFVNEVLNQGASEAYTAAQAGASHSAAQRFQNLTGVAEVVNGVATGYQLVSLEVPVGTYQIMLRSAIGDLTLPAGVTLLDQPQVMALLTAQEREIGSSLSTTITHVDPLLVARSVAVQESDGQAQIEVVAVGGDFANGNATLDVQTVDGAWTERTFVVSREYSTLGDVTLDWKLTLPDSLSLPAGKGENYYVAGYFKQNSVTPGTTDDFLALDGSTVVADGITGSVTLLDGEKEATIVIRVRADIVGEAIEDFKVTLTNAPASVQIINNPEKTAFYSDAIHNIFNSGAGRVVNDDRVFSVLGVAVSENTHSLVPTGQAAANLRVGNDYGIGITATDSADSVIALKAQWKAQLTQEWTGAGQTFTSADVDSYMAGYRLHQFVVKLDGALVGAASVDWQLRIDGHDTASSDPLNGNFDPGLQTPLSTDPVTGAVITSQQSRTAHGMERGDLLAYVGAPPAGTDAALTAYSQSFGFVWADSSPNSGNQLTSVSAAKRLYFAEGEAYKIVTVAIANDTYIEDAEQFSIELSNAQALEGSVSPAQINPAQSSAYVLVGDDDSYTVKLDVFKQEGSTRTALSSGVELMEGTAGAADTGRDVVLRFTRDMVDPGTGVAVTASQAYFELSYGGVEPISVATGIDFIDNPTVYKNVISSGSSPITVWAGVADFARVDDVNTTYDDRFVSETTIRIANDDVVQDIFLAGLSLNVNLYDAATLPSRPAAIRQADQLVQLDDSIGIGERATSFFADWNITRVDPLQNAFSLKILEDDIRLWVGDDSTTASTWSTPVEGADPLAPNLEGDGGWTFDATHHTPEKTNGDLVVTLSRKGYEAGGISMDWEIRLDGTADLADFNPASGLYTVDTTTHPGQTYLMGQAPVALTADGLVFAGLLANDLAVEDNETFTLILKDPVNADDKKVLFSPNFTAEGKAEDPSLLGANSVRGRTSMEAGIVIGNDDVTYGVTWNSTNTNGGSALEGDTTTSTPLELKFDITRTLGLTEGNGYSLGSTVFWRVVPKGGSAITAEDFLGDYGGGLPTGQVSFSSYTLASDTDTLKTVTLKMQGDNQLEFGEQFTIELYTPSIGHIDQAHLSVDGLIINDDTALRVDSTRVTEGDSGDTTVTVVVTRLGDLDRHTKATADIQTSFGWTVLDVDTNAADRGTGAFGATGVAMGDASTTTFATGMTDGYGTETTTLTFNVKGDAQSETDERLALQLTNITGVDEVLASSATVTVVNDDAVFSVVPSTAANNNILEGATGAAADYHFTITRNVSTPQSQTVTWSVVAAGGRNLVDATDFGGTLPTGTVTFAPGELSKEITFTPVSDLTAETDEVFSVEVTAFGTGAENDSFVATGVGAIGTIVNDDLSVFIGDRYPVVQAEGSDSANPLLYRFEVVRSGSPNGAPLIAVVDWELQFPSSGGATASDFLKPDGTPYADGDIVSGTVTLAQDGSQVVDLILNPDTTGETAQNFNIVLTNNGASTGSVTVLGSPAAARIGDDDYTLDFVDGTNAVVTSFSGAEGDGLSSLAVNVKRSGSDDLPVTATWTLQFGNAATDAAASDFRLTTGTFTIPAGQSIYTFNIPISGDVQFEGDENFTINLDYGVGTTSASGTLTNDDEGFSLAAIAPVKEDASGGVVTFTINREGNTTGASAVDWSLAGSGTQPTVAGDFSGTLAGTVNFANGETSKDVTVALVNDNVLESDETFTVSLANPSAGSSLKVGAVTAVGSVLNDDQGYAIQANSSLLTEDTATKTVVFTITRNVTDVASTVDWTLAKVSGASAAVEAADLLIDGAAASAAAFAANGLSFAIGEVSKTVTVTLAADSTWEEDAVLRMGLTRHTGDTTSTLVTENAVVTVRDDDSVLNLVEVSGGRRDETDNASEQAYTYQVTRTGSLSNDATFSWTLTGNGAHQISAADVSRITVDGVQVSASALASDSLTFAANGTAEKTITVYMKGDNTGEYDEGFKFSLSSPSTGATLATASATGVVVNDDPVLEMFMTTTDIVEGNEGDDRSLTFQVVRSGDTSGPSTVQWNLLGALSGNAVNATDFGGQLPAGVISFQAGESSKTVTILTAGDDAWEPDEGFRIVLSNPIGADILGVTQISGNILNDDVQASVVANTASVIEGQLGQSVNAGFTSSAQGLTTATRTLVNWHVEGVGQHPTNGADFVSGVLSTGQTNIAMSNGSGSATLNIAVAGDNTWGADEQFKVVIDSVQGFIGATPIGGSIQTKEALMTVLDDDILIGLRQTAHDVVELDTGATEVRFYVDQLERASNAPSMADVRVSYTLTGDVDATDFATGTNLTGSDVALQHDANGYYLAFGVQGDSAIEGNERFSVNLTGSNYTNARSVLVAGNVQIDQGGASAQGTVLDDDFGIALASPNLTQNEDSARFVFDVLRTGATDQALTVRWTLGTPTLGAGEYGVSANDFIDLQTGLPYSQSTSTPITGNVTFAAGEASARFVLEATHDALPETDERFQVKVEVTQLGANAVTADTNQTAYADAWISNDDPQPTGFDPAVDQVLHPHLDHVV
jgi:hypothetical protein